MAITLPSGLDLMQESGLRRFFNGDPDDTTYQAGLEISIIPKAAALVRLLLGETIWTSDDLTEAQDTGITYAITHQAVALILRSGATTVVRGEHEPLLVGEPEEFLAVAEGEEAMVARWVDLVTASAGTGTVSNGLQVVRLTSSTRQAWDEANSDLLVVNGPCYDDWG